VGNAHGAGRLLALLGGLAAGQEDLYAGIFGELDPEIYLAPLVAQLDSARQLGTDLFGCDTDRGGEREACVWGEAAHHSLTRKAGEERPRIHQSNGARLRLGVGVPVGGNVTLAGALAYDSTGPAYFGEGRGGYEGDQYSGGIGARLGFGKDQRGDVSLAGTVGRLDAPVSRHQSLFVEGVGTADVKSTAWGLTAAAGYRLGSGSFFARPAVIGSVTRLDSDGFAEAGLAGNGVAADDHGQTVLAVSPRLELGAMLGVGKISVTAGGVFRDTSELVGDFRLIGADPASDPARITTAIDSKAFVLGAEVGVYAGSRTTVSLRYNGEIGSTMASHTVDFDLSIAF
jgi:hypothetical protein